MGQIQINPGDLKGLIGNMKGSMTSFLNTADAMDIQFSENTLKFTNTLETRFNDLKGQLQDMANGTIASYSHMSSNIDQMTEVDRCILF
ncbi:MAG TPA: YwqI/YxiC family protein [Clostridiaceae bacterium]|nr:YwqI/YxiC family protein [Clostridiaceae bacterium]